MIAITPTATTVMGVRTPVIMFAIMDAPIIACRRARPAMPLMTTVPVAVGIAEGDAAAIELHRDSGPGRRCQRQRARCQKGRDQRGRGISYDAHTLLLVGRAVLDQ